MLVVDDDPDMAEAMVLVLDAAGYAARSAQNGKQALEEVAAQMPALILLDMLMPVMNGWQFARELHAALRHTRADRGRERCRARRARAATRSTRPTCCRSRST